MAYVNIILLALSILGIICGTVRLVASQKYISALIFTLLFSWWAVAILFAQICCNLVFIGLNWRFLDDYHFAGTLRALHYHDYLDLILLDLAGLAYAVFLVIFSMRGVLARELKPHTGSRISQ